VHLGVQPAGDGVLMDDATVADLTLYAGKKQTVAKVGVEFVHTASEDYATRIYPREAFAPFDELRALISQRVARELTDKERADYLKEPENQ